MVEIQKRHLVYIEKKRGWTNESKLWNFLWVHLAVISPRKERDIMDTRRIVIIKAKYNVV